VGRLDDRVALVTGASSGIGRAVAEAFAGEGAKLLLVAAPTDEAKLRDVAGGLGGHALALDVGDPSNPSRAIEAVEQSFGRLDVLVNNAGFAYLESALDMSAERWDRLMAVNLRGVFLLSQAFARHVVGRGGGGAVVNTASSNAVAPEPGLAAYNASKAAMLSLTRTLAMEFGAHGIRVNAVLPGMTYTRQTAELLDDAAWAHQYLPMIPLGRFAEPADIAPAYVFLASDEARYVTGSSLLVDGGLTAGLHWPAAEVSYDNERWEEASGA
jgi:NAD(P)-dependent dehydrogenase (short-subunit alcohol dehydrogenase family)